MIITRKALCFCWSYRGYLYQNIIIMSALWEFSRGMLSNLSVPLTRYQRFPLCGMKAPIICRRGKKNTHIEETRDYLVIPPNLEFATKLKTNPETWTWEMVRSRWVSWKLRWIKVTTHFKNMEPKKKKRNMEPSSVAGNASTLKLDWKMIQGERPGRCQQYLSRDWRPRRQR